MSYAAAGFMVVLVVHDLRARGPGKRPQSSRVNWQAGWRQTTSELTGQLAGRLAANDLRRQTTSELTGPLAGRLTANDLRQTTSELAGRHKTRYTENHRIPKITGLELAGRLANDL